MEKPQATMLKMRRKNKLICRIDVTAFLSIQIAILSLYLGRPVVDRPATTVELPKAHHSLGAPWANREDALIITVTYNGRIYFDVQQMLDPGWLSQRLRDRLRAGSERRVYLNVDRRARYRNVNQVLDQIHLVGVEKISILTETPRTPTAQSK